jgi:hypothetical protein
MEELRTDLDHRQQILINVENGLKVNLEIFENNMEKLNNSK